MRIVIANDGFGDVGGVQSYLDAIVPGLASRGHDISMLYLDEALSRGSSPIVEGLIRFSISRDGATKTIDALREWRPAVCFSHNMRDLDVDHWLLSVAPVIKFMHGYFGTCISGQKMFGLPVARPCSRTFGPPCLAIYFPRRCGQLNATTMVRDYRWATDQRDLFNRYCAILVASEHMRREYIRNGADEQRVHVTPLFSHRQEASDGPVNGRARSVVFIGRMTTLKGGDQLVRAIADASSRLASPIDLVMVGDGPQRAAWERLASRLRVRATFVGWKAGEERWEWLRGAGLLAVPSVWPEPFGLVGLEAAALGVPAIAFDVGGICEWLTHGENGHLVPANPPRASALADGLVTLFQHPEDLCAMRVKAAEAARRMSLDRHLERLEAILFEHAEKEPADSARR